MPETAPRRTPQSRDPLTGEVWRAFESATPDHVRDAIAAARGAQPAWAATPLRERARAVERFRRVLLRRRLEVAGCIRRETGKPAAEALGAEVLVVLDLARWYATRGPRALRARRFTPGNAALWRKRVQLTHEPYGVIGVVSPWNYPFMLPAGTVLAALLGGNAVVLKPSEWAPSTALLIGELAREAGVPAALLHVLPGDAATGAALVGGEVDKVFFTGSAAAGRRVAAACAERLVPCVLELGGSDPAIVLEDADLATAASGIVWGRFSNAGQTCVAPKRLLVVDAVYDALLARVAASARGLRLPSGDADGGDAHDVAPLIRAEQADQIEAQLADAVARGARVVAGGARAGDAVQPTVLADVTPEMRVMTEETFGPLLPVVRVRDAEEAVRLANASAFGLSASVWSRDLRRARALAGRLHAGTVTINDAIVAVGIAEVPHGGVKGSGSGRTHGEAGLMECVLTKSIVVDRLAGVRQPWWFGYGAQHLANIDAFLRFWHGAGLRQKLGGIPRSVKMLLRGERPL